MLPKITSEVGDTVVMLKKIACYKDLGEHHLIPLAANFDRKTYKLGEYIIKKGDIVPFFCVIE